MLHALRSELRAALETIRDAFWTDGETDKEKIDDLKAIAFNVLYEIDNNIEVELCRQYKKAKK